MAEIIYKTQSMDSYSPQKLPQKFSHPQRNKQYFLGRETLGHCLNYFQQDHNPYQLEFTPNYQTLQGHEHLSCSLSHNRKMAIAIMGSINHFKSLGVDLEDINRPIAPESDRHFINEQDQFASHTLLEKWCIKEACFKALHSLHPECKLLKQVIVHENRFYFQDQKDSHHQLFQVTKTESMIIVMSYIKNKNVHTVEFKNLA
ncbi:MAG: hypothetical protein CME62_09910 [Halobacteriovoraceae bacterium]|nr:hypothetical protein [Halobacteriovoraceae bacterium]|tara:strand:+ start:14708 stop:15313 length:606 start_codon:yes stop_codon:yes gene_type:complete